MNSVQTMPIHVAMITLNGAEFLAAQLQSIAAQTLVPASVWISDDGSTDGTLKIARAFQSEAPFPVHLIEGPGLGPAANMATLISAMPISNIATCDQDDIWLPKRLELAADYFASVPHNRPTIHVCQRARTIRRRRQPSSSFANALTENRAPGNAATFNTEATSLISRNASLAVAKAPFFDWWSCQLVVGSGGYVHEDPTPGLWYRAHRRNILGPRWSATGFANRIKLLKNGTFRHWMIEQARVLSFSKEGLMPENQAILECFLQTISNGGLIHPVCRRSAWEQVFLDVAFRLAVNSRFTS